MNKAINVVMALNNIGYDEALIKVAAFYGLSVEDAKQIAKSEVDTWLCQGL